MSRLDVPFRSRALPNLAAFSLIAIAAAGCSDSARFSSRQSPPQDVTGSVATRPVSRVESQTLPAPSRPATVALGSVSYGAPGLGAYRPTPRAPEVTGSVAPKPATSGHWTWDGGAPVTIMPGETVETIARRYGVPASAIMETNGFTSESAIKPGQRLVIPRYVSGSAPAQAPVHAAAANEGVHIVAPGESLMAVSRKYGVTLSALARANNLHPSAALNVGDRLVIPGGIRHVAALQAPTPAPAPKIAAPRTIKPSESVGSLPPENARVVTPEPTTGEDSAKSAEAAGSLPSFRWPAKGRVIAGFGTKINGVSNDGINVAVPEGTPVKAAEDGVVAYAGNELKGYGNLVLLRHANGYVSAYANASELMVKKGDSVKRGQVIAHSGQTGNVTSPQLHFEIRKGSTPVDPMQFLGNVVGAN
jgi:murein DD-endopeptidase MepM/ murein hydrolase activator NlpD